MEVIADANVATASWQLMTLVHQRQPSDALTVYFEGDGAAWSTPWTPPSDPTPLQPTVLAMAAQDPAKTVAYLGRPCQYLQAHALVLCDPALWMQKRFAPDVVDVFDATLTQLKASLGAKQLRLVGYSGGGVIAALLATRRHDVEQLITVASPLALTAWTTWHGISPFTESSDPLHQPGALPPSQHWVGQNDKVVPPAIVAQFAAAKGGGIKVVQGYDHQCCWARDWARLMVTEHIEGDVVWPKNDPK